MGNLLKRRRWLQSMGALGGTLLTRALAAEDASPQASDPGPQDDKAILDIGSRRELFVDDWLIDETSGCRRQLNRPERREIVFRTDAAWEGNGCAYQSIVPDGERWLMYYRGGHHPASPAFQKDARSWETLCVAESKDGLHWTRPIVDKIDFRGSKKNNLIVDEAMVADIAGSPAHTSVFRDENPDCPSGERFKMVMYGRRPKGLYLLVSKDGIDFRLKHRTPFTTRGAFDSQNLMFWDPVQSVYREYHRSFSNDLRVIMTATSPDPFEFPEPKSLQYPGASQHALYTNQVQPYYRAPHLLLGFPMRYVDRGWTPSTEQLPNLEARRYRASQSLRYGTAVTDALLMCSRDGERFELWDEAFIRPGPSDKDTWVYGDNFIFWGMVETPSALASAPPEISLYATEGYWEGDATSVRRYVSRLDGFASLTAPYEGGEVLTKPLRFSGRTLKLNFATSAAGSVQVGLEHPNGEPLPGHDLDACDPAFGDHTDGAVSWNQTNDLSALAGQPVRLRFRLSDADLFAFRFAE